jgi:hypothetical protein
MSNVPEYQIREVRRYIVTRFHAGDQTSRVIGEFPAYRAADEVAEAMAKADGGMLLPNNIKDSPAREADER